MSIRSCLLMLIDASSTASCFLTRLASTLKERMFVVFTLAISDAPRGSYISTSILASRPGVPSSTIRKPFLLSDSSGFAVTRVNLMLPGRGKGAYRACLTSWSTNETIAGALKTPSNQWPAPGTSLYLFGRGVESRTASRGERDILSQTRPVGQRRPFVDNSNELSRMLNRHVLVVALRVDLASAPARCSQTGKTHAMSTENGNPHKVGSVQVVVERAQTCSQNLPNLKARLSDGRRGHAGGEARTPVKAGSR
jgi:hypothetical protein